MLVRVLTICNLTQGRKYSCSSYFPQQPNTWASKPTCIWDSAGKLPMDMAMSLTGKSISEVYQIKARMSVNIQSTSSSIKRTDFTTVIMGFYLSLLKVSRFHVSRECFILGIHIFSRGLLNCCTDIF